MLTSGASPLKQLGPLFLDTGSAILLLLLHCAYCKLDIRGEGAGNLHQAMYDRNRIQ
jgi:hypothetical protein